jgi:glycopeptide antibiotics resistance protein
MAPGRAWWSFMYPNRIPTTPFSFCSDARGYGGARVSSCYGDGSHRIPDDLSRSGRMTHRRATPTLPSADTDLGEFWLGSRSGRIPSLVAAFVGVLPILRCMGDAISTHGPSTTGVRLTFAMLGYYVAVIAVITLVPFRFIVPESYTLLLTGTPLDTAANVLLFVPLGFLYRLARPPARDPAALGVLALGVLTSCGIEAIQLFEPARFSSPIDVAANGLGAWMGAVATDRITRFIRADSQLVARLSLEIPLMGLVYMLIPLLWLGSLAAGGDPLRLALLLLPGLFGAQLLSFVHRHRLGRPGRVSASAVAIAAAIGMFVGVFPASAAFPFGTLGLAIAVAAFVRFRSTALSPSVPNASRYTRRAAGNPDARDRRFEGRALRAALPFYAAYLLAAAWLARASAGPENIDRLEILRSLELAAVFTVLGYLLAEWRGRIEERARQVALAVIARAAPLAVVVAGFRFLPGAPVEALLWLAATVAASLYGAGLYHLQRAHIQALIAATSHTAAPMGLRDEAA